MIARPLRFLLGVVLAWAVGRTIWLWPRASAPRAAPMPRWMAPPPSRPTPMGRRARTDRADVPISAPGGSALLARRSPPANSTEGAPQQPVATPDEASTAPRVAAMTSSRPRLRATVSAWALVRPSGGSAGLAPGGQLDASQAGVRATVRIRDDLAAAVRLSAPLAVPTGREAALALDWRPDPHLPVTFTLERRIALDRGGRDAWGVGAFGGASELPVIGRATLDIYAQAGLVGARRRDAYADGAARITHPIRASGFAGAGLWGAAQPGVARLDIGPLLGARIGRARVSLEWRARIAGRAAPASGPALSLGADF